MKNMNIRDRILGIVGIFGVLIWVIAMTVMFFPFLG